MPSRYAMPAQTPPSQPSARTTPSPRIQSKNRVPRPENPVRGPPYGFVGVPTGGVESFCDMVTILVAPARRGHPVNP
jgi:hypothetical protein